MVCYVGIIENCQNNNEIKLFNNYFIEYRLDSSNLFIAISPIRNCFSHRHRTNNALELVMKWEFK